METEANISRAIARSRRARRTLQSRRRRAALAAGALLLAAVPLSFSLVGVTSNDLVQAAVSGANSLSDLLNRRSPGQRTAAQLTKTKHARPAPKHWAAAPPDRSPAAPAIAGKIDFGEVSELVLGPPEVDIAPPITDLALNAPELPAIIGGSGPGVVESPGGGAGGGGGGGPVSFPASEPHKPISVTALPEPGTWATMLLGFGLLGWRMRRGSKPRTRKATA